MSVNIPPCRGVSRFFSWRWMDPEFAGDWGLLSGNDSGSGETIWQTRHKEVRLLTVPSANGAYRIAVKNYHEKRLLRYLCRPSLALREAMGFRVAEALGIPTVRVLAFGETRRMGILTDAFFVTRFAENTRTLNCFEELPEEHDRLMRLLRENIARIGRLHAAGWTHGGAHSRNFLWRETPDGGLESIWLDLATVRPMPRRGPDWPAVLTDLSDMVEYFRLTGEDLKDLTGEYRRYHDIPVELRQLPEGGRKFSAAFRI